MTETVYSGQVLYHYTSERGLLGILKSRCIRATAIQDLADETELIYGRELVADGFEQEADRNTDARETQRLSNCAHCTRALPDLSELIRRGGQEPVADDARLEWYIACLSEDRDSLPLWRGFTRECTGYALGLRYRAPESLLSDFVHYPPQRVIYDPGEQTSVVSDTVANARRCLDDPDDMFKWTIALGSILTLKAPLFSSEREWRVVWRQSEHFRYEEGTWLPGRKRNNPRAVHFINLPLRDWELVEIICGPRSRLGPTSRKIREGIKEFGGQPADVPVVKSACRLWR